MPTGIYRHKSKYKNILTKNFLIKEYLNNKKSSVQIAKEVRCNQVTVRNYLKKLKIKIRHIPDNYIDGRTNRKCYCKDCNKKIHWITAIKGKGRCQSCAKKYYWKLHPKTKKKYYCIDCGKIITYDSWHYGSKLCGSCSHKGERSNGYIDGRTTKIHYCKEFNCNNEICYQTWKFGSGLCMSCSIGHLFKNPENHPRWNNGSSFEPYPLGWTNTFKEQIRYRDGYKCQICGCHEVECNKKLSVHHIDYNKENINPENLTSLCTSCHMKTNGNREYWIKYFNNKLKKFNRKV